jgi:intracellular sulfur oxidation DsrE/DsrF family protein
MNKSVLLFGCFLFSFLTSIAQPDYRVVFDLTSKDSLDQKAVIRWVNEVTKAEPTAQVEIVMYGQGLNMVVKGKSSVEEAVNRLTQNKNVALKVCAVAMKNQNIAMDQLLPGVQTVPDGIYEIISKQRQGWGYIKAVH